MSYGDILCPICRAEKNPRKNKCARCKKLPIKVDIESEGYFGK